MVAWRWACLLVAVGCGSNGPGAQVTAGNDGGESGVGTTQPAPSASTGTAPPTSATTSGGGDSTGAPTSSSSTGGDSTDSESGTSGDSGSSSSTTSPACIGSGRIYQGDGCNFCDCEGGELANCTARTCVPINEGCDYGVFHFAYGEVFDSDDRCNICVCAASGLACTRRPECDDGLEEGAILLESLDTPCGEIPEFTGQWVLDQLAPFSFGGPLDYNNDGMPYPETLPDTSLSWHVTYDDGFVVCRIPAPGQEALDIEAIVEWRTADGAFDEGQQTYVRRQYASFAPAVTSLGVVFGKELYGSYDHGCPDAGAIVFAPQVPADDPANGQVFKVCETDLGLTLGTWQAED